MYLAAMSPGLFVSARRFEILAQATPLLIEALTSEMEGLKAELEAYTSVRNVSLFLAKVWPVHVRAFSFHLGPSNKHADVSLESCVEKQNQGWSVHV
jgi:hypothetical protein